MRLVACAAIAFAVLASSLSGQDAAPSEPKLEEITATELNARRLRGDRMQIIDVREPHEFDIAKIPGTKLIPLNHVVTRMNEIDQEVADELVLAGCEEMVLRHFIAK